MRARSEPFAGAQGIDDGVPLVVAKDDHRVRIEVGYGLEGAIPDITAGRVIQNTWCRGSARATTPAASSMRRRSW